MTTQALRTSGVIDVLLLSAIHRGTQATFDASAGVAPMLDKHSRRSDNAFVPTSSPAWSRARTVQAISTKARCDLFSHGKSVANSRQAIACCSVSQLGGAPISAEVGSLCLYRCGFFMWRPSTRAFAMGVLNRAISGVGASNVEARVLGGLG